MRVAARLRAATRLSVCNRRPGARSRWVCSICRMTRCTRSSVTSAAIVYANGPIELCGAWQLNEKFRGPGLKDNAYTVAAAWNFGFLRLAGVYERLDYDTPGGDLKRNLWGASVTVPVGAGTFYAS